MAVRKKAITPRYVSFYAAGSRFIEIPLSMEKKGIIASPLCVNIPAMYWNDGDTSVTLGHFDEVAQARQPDFDGLIATPERELVIFDAEMPEIMKTSVPTQETRVRIWMNHPTEPNDVVIAFGG